MSKFIVFKKIPHFMPCLNPVEMLKMGVYGGQAYYGVSIPFELVKACKKTGIKPSKVRYHLPDYIGKNQFGVFSVKDYKQWFRWYVGLYYDRQRDVDDADLNIIGWWQDELQKLKKMGYNDTRGQQAMLELAWYYKEPLNF